jgi:hypothetical protein
MEVRSRVVQAALKEHEMKALLEYLEDREVNRYRLVRRLVIAELVDEGYLEIVSGTRDGLEMGKEVVTRYLPPPDEHPE